MTITDPANSLTQIFNATGLAEVVRASGNDTQVSLLYRVRDKRAWLAMVEYLLRNQKGWDAHICQQYFLRGDSLVYGWNFILEAKLPGKAVKDIAALVEKGMSEIPKQLSKGILQSFPLVGASPRRTAKIAFNPQAPGPARGGPSQKGAHNI